LRLIRNLPCSTWCGTGRYAKLKCCLASTQPRLLQLRPVDRGANVVLVDPFDPVVYRGASVVDGLTYAAASQVVVDLLTGPGRAPEEGESLIEALATKTKVDATIASTRWARQPGSLLR